MNELEPGDLVPDGEDTRAVVVEGTAGAMAPDQASGEHNAVPAEPLASEGDEVAKAEPMQRPVAASRVRDAGGEAAEHGAAVAGTGGTLADRLANDPQAPADLSAAPSLAEMMASAPEVPPTELMLQGTAWISLDRPQGRAWRRTLSDVVAELRNPRPELRGRPKGELPLWSLASFLGDRRSKDRLLHLHGLNLDLDNAEDATCSKLLMVFGDWCFLAHTTPSHRPDSPRWRVILPLSRPATPDEAEALCKRWAPALCARSFRLGSKRDPVSSEAEPPLDAVPPSQAMFVPAPGPHYQCVINVDRPLLDPDEALAELSREAEAGPADPLDGTLVSSFMATAIDRLARRASGTEKPIPLPWPNLAALMGGGLWPGLTVLVGNPGGGKSQFALQIALEAARQGTPVLYVGLELDREGLMARLLGLLHGCWWSDLYLGKRPWMRPKGPETSLADAVRAGEEILAHLPLHMAFCPPMGFNYRTLTALCTAMRRRYPEILGDDNKPLPGSRPFLAVLDFLQIVAGEPGESLRERIGGAAYAGRAVARELDAAVVLISSTARDNYGRLSGGPELDANGKPRKAGKPAWEGPAAALVGLSKEAGEIEYAADWLLVLCREPRAEGDAGHLSLVHVAAAKVRAGREGWAALSFDGAAFADADDEVQRRKAMAMAPAAGEQEQQAKTGARWADDL